MKSFHLNSNPAVTLVFNKYPDHVRKKLLLLRRIIIETAEEIPEIKELEETLKWGDPNVLESALKKMHNSSANVSSGKTFTKSWHVSKSEKGKIIISVPDRLTYPYSNKSPQNQLPG